MSTKKYWHCEYYNWNQSGGLRDKKDGQQEFYAKMSSLAYENEASRIKGLQKLGFEYDKELSNDDIMIAVNKKTGELVSTATGSRFTSKKHMGRDIRSDIGIALGTDRWGKRKKEVKEVVKKAVEKYKGYDHTLSGHSAAARTMQNISKETGIPAVIFNRGSSPIGALTDKITKWLGKDKKESKVIHYTTNKGLTIDPVSISAKLLGDDTETIKVKKKKDVISHSISHFTGAGKQNNTWINHVKAYAKKNNVSYRQAMKESSKSYKK
ncbi:MAG: hypothetical protein RL498_391 [Pseudomonadota bacterium]|jgi:hypothetical protein